MQIPGLRWLILGLLFLATLLAYLDLQDLSVLAPILQDQLSIDDGQYAFITQGFLASYTTAFLVGGFIIDKLGVRNGLTLSLLWCSIATAGHALADNATELAFWRFFMGLGYPGVFLAAARVVSEWFPVQERALAYGIYISGATFGGIIAYPLVVWLSLTWSWQGPFLVTGVIGIAAAAVWYLAYRRPELHPWATSEERDYVRAGRVEEAPKQETTLRFKDVLRTRPFWAVALGRFVADSTWMFYVLWLAKFLVDEHGMSIEDVGRYGWIPWALANVGSIAGGWCSGVLIRRGIATHTARLAVLAVCAGIRAFTFLLDLPMSTPLLLGMIGFLMMCTTAWQVNLSVINVDSYPSRLISTISGATTSFGTLSSVFFQSVVAWFLLHYSYKPVLALISALSVVAFLIVYVIMRDAPKPLAVNLQAAG